MKKLFFILILILLANLTYAKDVGLVVSNSANSNMINILNEMNYSYSVIKNSNIPSTNFSNYAVLIIQDDVSNKALLPLTSKNSIFFSRNIASIVWPSVVTGTTSSNKLRFEQLGTVFTEGFSSIDINVYTSSRSVQYLRVKPSIVKKIAYLTSSQTSGYSAVAYSSSSVRSIFFGLADINYWTSDTKKLFKNTLKYSREGMDFDKDGFFLDDCDDNNPLVNPNATEIPYNNLDDDCSGGDLRDVDGDGFDIGLDCNDSNKDINPNATEIIDNINQNCRNDAPVFTGNIPAISWNEDSKLVNFLNLKDYFYDTDGDTLTYYIKSTSSNEEITLVITNGIVSFYSSKDWNGADWVIFGASDGNSSSSSNMIVLTVNPVNDAPVIENIGEIVLIEGEAIKITPRVYDAENDTISLSFYSPLNSSGEWQTKIGDSGIYSSYVVASDSKNYSIESFSINVLPKIVINEIGAKSSPDWIEIYNPRNNSINLGNCEIKDAADNKLALEGILNKNKFMVFNWSNRLNNDGDNITLFCYNKTIDNLDYTGFVFNEGESIARKTDGGKELVVLKYPTKGLSNMLDAEPPKVTLLAPLDNSLVRDREFYINFTATDNLNNMKCHFYSNIAGEFEQLGKEIELENNTVYSIKIREIADGNYYWNILCSDGRNSAFAEKNYSFSLDKYDIPVISPIPDSVLQETEKLIIEINATDADNDNLVYFVNEIELINNIFEWQTDYGDRGEYEFTARVTDGIYNSTRSFKISVLKSNRAPELLNNIPDLSWNEDEFIEIDLSEYFLDLDGDSLIYSIAGDVLSSIANNILKLSYEENEFGEREIRIIASDSQESIESNIIKTNVIEVNDAPEIVSYSPLYDPIITEDGSQEFNIEARDSEDSLDIIWKVDGVEKDSGESFIFLSPQEGIYEIKAIISDGEHEITQEWEVLSSSKPVVSKYNLSFDNMTEEELSDTKLVIGNEFGKIEFLNNLDLREIVDFEHYSYILFGLVALDSNYLKLVDQPARITLYNINSMPEIYYSEEFTTNPDSIQDLCPASICSDINYNGDLSFITTSFSSFRVGEQLTCSQRGGEVCSRDYKCQGSISIIGNERCCLGECVLDLDIDECSSIDNEIEIEITNPDEGDDFNIGEKITVKLKISNNAEEDIELDIKASLYDKTDNDELTSKEENIDVDEGESEKIEIEIEIPENADEDNDFMIFVRAEGDGFCNQESVNIKLEREKHKIIIDRVEINPYNIKCGSEIFSDIFVKNIGRNDEDLSIVAEINQLGLRKQASIELERFGDSDETDVMLDLSIPEDIESGTYEIITRVSYDYGEETRTDSIIIDCPKISFIDVKEDIVEIEEKKVERKISYFDILFVILIGIVLLLIIIAALRR